MSGITRDPANGDLAQVRSRNVLLLLPWCVAVHQIEHLAFYEKELLI